MATETVTVAAGATYWQDSLLYQPGDSLDVFKIDAERGKYHGVFT